MADESDVAVSGPDTGNAGDKTTDPLDKAFAAAFESVDVEDSSFVAPAKPAKGKTEARQIDKPATEDAAPAEPGGEEAEPETEPETPEAPPAEPEVAAPAHWDAQKREAFGKLPPDARKVVLDLAKGFEADHTRKSMELAEDRKFAQGVRSLITDGHRQQLRASGLDEIGGLSRLIQLNDYATQDGKGYVRWVVGQMGVDPRQIFPELAGGTQEQPYEAPPADPQYQQLNETIQRLDGEVKGFKRQQEESKLRTAERSIAAFREAKDESTGQPKYVHMQTVEPAMARILTTDPEILAIDDYGERLKRAYDLAVYRDPTIRDQIIDGEVAKRQAEAAKQADLNKAKRARAPIQSAPLSSPSTKPKSIDDAVRMATSQLGVS